MANPVFIDLAPELRAQVEGRRAVRGVIARRADARRAAALHAHRERGPGLGLASFRRPMLAASGGDARQGIDLRIYRDGPGDYRAVALVPWVCRNERGEKERCMFAVEVKIDRVEEDDGAVSGADFGNITSAVIRPVLDKVQAVLNHPLAALAASASVLIPGVGPAYVVGYAITQSLIDYAERKTR